MAKKGTTRTAAATPAPAAPPPARGKPSSLLDPRVGYGGDNPDQLAAGRQSVMTPFPSSLGLSLWSVAMMAGGLFVVGYAVKSSRRGWVNVGKPPRDIFRSAQPGEFWGNIALLVLAGSAFATFGLLVFTRVIVLH